MLVAVFLSAEHLSRFMSRDVNESEDDLGSHECVDAVWREVQEMVQEIETAAARFPHASRSGVALRVGLERDGEVDSALRMLFGAPPQLPAIVSALEHIRAKFGDTRVTYDAFVRSRAAITSIIEIRKVMT